jgi:hypothetical protein
VIAALCKPAFRGDQVRQITAEPSDRDETVSPVGLGGLADELLQCVDSCRVDLTERLGVEHELSDWVLRSVDRLADPAADVIGVRKEQPVV